MVRRRVATFVALLAIVAIVGLLSTTPTSRGGAIARLRFREEVRTARQYLDAAVKGDSALLIRLGSHEALAYARALAGLPGPNAWRILGGGRLDTGEIILNVELERVQCPDNRAAGVQFSLRSDQSSPFVQSLGGIPC